LSERRKWRPASVKGSKTTFWRDAGEPAPGRGWQSEKDLHHLDKFRGLVACIHDAAESVLGFLKTGDGAFELTGLWANMNPKGAAHPVHRHELLAQRRQRPMLDITGQREGPKWVRSCRPSPGPL
jgi:hypothetical protein